MDIAKILEQIGLSPEVVFKLSSKLSPVIIEKNNYFVRYGEKMNRIGILFKGLLVSRYSSEEGVEITSKFYYPNGDNIVVDYYCFKNQLNSEEEIQAVERSDLLTLSFRDYEFLLHEYPPIQKLVIKFTEQSYLKALSRVRDFQLMTAEERVKKFHQTHISIANKVKIKDKASYLGMSRNVFTENFKKI